MRGKIILAATTIVLATATGALAQSMQYDRTGDHMVSYGAGPNQSVAAAPAGPARIHVERHSKVRAAGTVSVPVDRTADHMLYYGPVAQ